MRYNGMCKIIKPKPNNNNNNAQGEGETEEPSCDRPSDLSARRRRQNT